MSIIAVTGSKGFIGKRLVHELEKIGHSVVKIDLPEHDLSIFDPLIKDRDLDLRGVDVVYHLATMNLKNCSKSHISCIEHNIIGTANLLEWARIRGVKRIIYSSASSVYGQPYTQKVSELNQTDPLTLYGVTKLASEKLIKVFSMQNKMSYCIFRFTNVYGPGQVNGVIPAIIKSLLEDSTITITGTGHQSRDFVFIDDVIHYLLAALEKPSYGVTLNLGSGQETSINTLVEYLSCTMCKSPRIVYQPMEIDRNAFRASLIAIKEVYGDHDAKPILEGLVETVSSFRFPLP